MLADDAIDDLPFGAIRLNAAGIILGYNRFESRLSGLEPARVIGKNFFTEVAPCTNVQRSPAAFAGRAARRASRRLPHIFSFSPPCQVTITMYVHRGTGNAWVPGQGRHALAWQPDRRGLSGPGTHSRWRAQHPTIPAATGHQQGQRRSTLAGKIHGGDAQRTAHRRRQADFWQATPGRQPLRLTRPSTR